MKKPDSKKIVVFINRIIASNNPRMAVSVLKSYGYNTPYDIIPANEIEKALNDLYLSDYQKYISAVRSIPYKQDATNWTTSIETKEQIRDMARELNMNDQTAKSDLQGAIDWIKNAITSTTVIAGGAGTVTQESAVPAAVILIVSVLAIGAVLWIWKSSAQ